MPTAISACIDEKTFAVAQNSHGNINRSRESVKISETYNCIGIGVIKAFFEKHSVIFFAESGIVNCAVGNRFDAKNQLRIPLYGNKKLLMISGQIMAKAG